MLTICISMNNCTEKSDDGTTTPPPGGTEADITACIDLSEGTSCTFDDQNGSCSLDGDLLRCITTEDGEEGEDALEPIEGQIVGVSDFSSDDYNVCFITGENKDVMCFGSNKHGQVGNGKTCLDYSPDGECYSNLASEKDAGNVLKESGANLNGAISVSNRTSHACAVLEGGDVWCWGRNLRGELGIGNKDEHSKAIKVPGLSNAKEVSVGMNFSCALANGEVYCWGSNEYGQVGNGKDSNSYEHQQWMAKWQYMFE